MLKEEEPEVALGDAPLPTELVGGQLTSPDPALKRLLGDLQVVANLMKRQQAAKIVRALSRHR